MTAIEMIAKGFCDCVEFAEHENHEELTQDAKDIALKVCTDFYTNNKSLIDNYSTFTNYYSIGHDFWLTLRGHGSGFWDRNMNEGLEHELTRISKEYTIECIIYEDTIDLEWFVQC